jgi:hypothetical protein
MTYWGRNNKVGGLGKVNAYCEVVEVQDVGDRICGYFLPERGNCIVRGSARLLKYKVWVIASWVYFAGGINSGLIGYPRVS